MHRIALAGLPALLCLVSSITTSAAQANETDTPASLQVGAHGGTLGLGVSAGIGISERLVARALFNQFALDYEETESDNEFEGDLDLQSIGLVTDWHPLASGLRLTSGIFVNNNEVSATATATDLDIGGDSYDGRLDMLLDFERIAPYFGVGWTSGHAGGPGLGLSLDAGLLYQQSPRLQGSGTAGGCSFDVTDSGSATVRGCPSNIDPVILKTNLESEHADLSDDLDDFKWYPVVSVGVSYRF